jgi:hypothetical protein
MDKPTCPVHPYAHLSELGCVMCNGMSLAAKEKLRASKSKRKSKSKWGLGREEMIESAAEDLEDSFEDE